jgi:hypothetical protein
MSSSHLSARHSRESGNPVDQTFLAQARVNQGVDCFAAYFLLLDSRFRGNDAVLFLGCLS